jgi:sugar phosphate isomerase/epimerase
MAPQVYVSTGAARDVSAATWAAVLLESGIYPLEMSGGIHSARAVEELRDLASQTPVMLHNYFPPPEAPFVLNLASQDKDVLRKSEELVVEALDLSAALGASHYAVHSGYCLDPDVDSLGKPLRGTPVGSRTRAMDTLVEMTSRLARHAEDVGVRLLIENHALSEFNISKFGGNPLLLVDPEETLAFISVMSGRVGLLLDVGHLKVSAHSLGFDLHGAIASLLPVCEGFHLSDNDGTSDQHLSFDQDAWFLPYLRGRTDFMTVEIHHPNHAESIRAAQSTITYLASGGSHA